jgi:predicted Zn-ribbon and HTH transcriptional regulator
MTAAGMTRKEIERLLNADTPFVIEKIKHEVRRHDEQFNKILKNIQETSLNFEDEKIRTEPHCIEYGYRFTTSMMRYPVPPNHSPS